MHSLARKPVLYLCLYVTTQAQAVPADGDWKPAGVMAAARTHACSTLLLDGRILIAGGTTQHGDVNGVEFVRADGTFSPAAPMLEARSGHTCTTLQDGRVLAAGGTSNSIALQSAEIFDPVRNSRQPGGAMTEARDDHTATLLTDGRVLIAGGRGLAAVSGSLARGRLSVQNEYRNANCICRDAPAVVIVPAFGALTNTTGALKFA
jgi:hypothetical protein